MEECVEYIVAKDDDGNTLSGEKSYGFHLPPNIPATEYWSVILYDSQTNLIIKNDQLWPSVFRTSKGLAVNQDGSIDVRFRPSNRSTPLRFFHALIFLITLIHMDYSNEILMLLV